MPIRFKSRHSPDIVMLETAGRELIRMMGHSGTVPGALGADDIGAALQRLESTVAANPGRALKADSERDADDKDRGDREPQVNIRQRALPLIEMLRAAMDAGDYVHWEQ